MSFRWPAKDPDEILDYDIDWTKRLYTEDELEDFEAGESVIPADSISTSTFTLPAQTGSNQLVANSSTKTSTATKVWLAGGVAGERYEILNRIVTTGGRTMDQTVTLKIKAR